MSMTGGLMPRCQNDVPRCDPERNFLNGFLRLWEKLAPRREVGAYASFKNSPLAARFKIRRHDSKWKKVALGVDSRPVSTVQIWRTFGSLLFCRRWDTDPIQWIRIRFNGYGSDSMDTDPIQWIRIRFNGYGSDSMDTDPIQWIWIRFNGSRHTRLSLFRVESNEKKRRQRWSGTSIASTFIAAHPVHVERLNAIRQCKQL
jgi:hypothetical protein